MSCAVEAKFVQQLVAIFRCCEHTPQYGGCFLFDDIGLGKTGTCAQPSHLNTHISDQHCQYMSAVIVLAVLAQNPLVVAPGALVVENWKQEAMKFIGTKGTQIVACPSTKALQEFIKDPSSSVEDMHILIIPYNAPASGMGSHTFFAHATAVTKQLFLFSMWKVAEANLAAGCLG
jgi:hypothetical protein